MKILYILVIVLIFIGQNFSQDKYAKREDYFSIKEGITYSEVVEILGLEGTLDSTETYIWKEENLVIEWSKGKMLSYGRANQTLSDSAVDGYKLIKEATTDPSNPLKQKNLSYNDVVKIIGKAGVKSDKVTYLWPTSSGVKIRITFKEKTVVNKGMW
jgi:hypothetical protein